MKLAGAAIALLASASFAADLAPLWSVHIDHPRDVTAYQRIDREQANIRRNILAAHGIAPLPVWKIRTADGVYMSFRPRQTMSDFNNPSSLPAEVREEIARKAGPLDDEIHKTLRTHHNEVWELDRAVTYMPDHQCRLFGMLRSEQVRPSKLDEYTRVMRRVHDAFVQSHAAVIFLAFYASYGDGAYHYLWVSDDRTTLRSVLISAFGKREAESLLQRWTASVTDTREVAAAPLVDLTASDPARWLP